MRSRLQRKAVCCALTKQHCGRTALNTCRSTCIHAMHTHDAKCPQPDGRRGKASRLTGRRKHAVDQLLLSALRARQLRLLHQERQRNKCAPIVCMLAALASQLCSQAARTLWSVEALCCTGRRPET